MYRCWPGRLYSYVDATGDVFPCGDIMGRVPPTSFRLARQSLDALPTRPFLSCIVACYVELNLMFSLDIRGHPQLGSTRVKMLDAAVIRFKNRVRQNPALRHLATRVLVDLESPKQ